MNIGTRGHDFKTDTIEELAKKCSQYSIGNIQLALKKSVADFKEGNFSKEYALEIGNILKNYNVKIPVLGCYINPSEKDGEKLKMDLDYFVENLQYAKYIGADMVGLETGYVENNNEEAYQNLLKTMKFLLNKAENIGVKIGIEGVHCFVINTPEKMKRIMDDLNSENACVIFDPVNYLNIDNYKRQDEIFKSCFKLLSDKIAVVHLKDFKIENGKMSYEYPCSGLLSTELIFNNIMKINRDIPIIFEEVPEDMLLNIKKKVADKISLC